MNIHKLFKISTDNSHFSFVQYDTAAPLHFAPRLLVY